MVISNIKNKIMFVPVKYNFVVGAFSKSICTYEFILFFSPL